MTDYPGLVQAADCWEESVTTVSDVPTTSVLRSSRWVALAFTVGLFASACGSTESVQTQAANATEVVENEVPDVEAEVSDDGVSEPEAATPATSDEAELAEPVDDPLFFGEYASLAGESVNLADYAGQDVVLWFWAPW